MPLQWLYVQIGSILIFFCVFANALQNIKEIKCESAKFYPFVFNNHAVKNNRSSGNFSEVTTNESNSNIVGCTAICCEKKDCHVAMLYNSSCFLISCISSAGCLPVQRNTDQSTNLEMVLVRTVKEEETWEEIMRFNSDNNEEQQHRENDNAKLDFLNNIYNYDVKSKLFDALKKMSSHEDEEEKIPTVYGQERQFASDDMSIPNFSRLDGDFNYCGPRIGVCNENEECVRLNREQGVCKCKHGFTFIKKECIPRSIIPVVPASFSERIPKLSQENSEEEPEKIKLQVSVESKNIQLPINEAWLTAKVVPDDEKLSYLWSLVDKPENDKNGTITSVNNTTVRVSNLSEGLYKFKVTVSGENSYGETFVNLTVLPAARINKPPVSIILPKYQNIKLPNNKAVLDGSASTDDDKIVKYKWELVQGPLTYSPTLQESPTIELTDLKETGNYTFKLIVTDSDNAENSTIAIIEVDEEIDYPPIANAGTDVILYLPHNNIELNGTLSTDDHGIVSWEWTKISSDEAKAVDMQNTHTPNLSLSHLEEGIYTFELKVTDAKGQNSSSKVHVFVKPPTNLPPSANAGKNSTISLPQSFFILNANQSTDDIKITQYYWRQISGPQQSIILNSNNSIANATSLTLGDYIFELTVIDENNNNATDRIKITVIQEKNAPPVAKIDGNRNVSLPLSVLIINGSRSYDDLAIVNYSWTRESDSLAVGNIIGNSDHESVLQLTNIVPGQYKYKLTVSDEQGLTGSDKVTINVFEDPLILNLVEVILNARATTLKEQELEQLKQKLLLLLGDNVQLNVRDLRVDDKTGHVILIFYASSETKQGTAIMSALEVQHILKWKDFSILGSSIKEIRTVVCQNDCSGHGVCDEETRACICETFWMPDIFFYWHLTEANCDWSILYVIVFIFFLFLLISGICWGLAYSCRAHKNKTLKKTSSRPSRSKRPLKYALLHSQENELPSFNRNTLSDDSDTDSDVLFENSRQKLNGTRSNKSRKLKMGRRIKT